MSNVMSLYQWGPDTICAVDEADVRAVIAETYGAEEPDEYDEDIESIDDGAVIKIGFGTLDEVPHWLRERLESKSVILNAQGLLTQRVVLEFTAREWADNEGRGHVGSSEY